MAGAGRRVLVAGNWKMNGTGAALSALRTIVDGVAGRGAEVVICPPATLLSRAAEIVAGSPVALGGQDCHAAVSGAHTGDLSAEMLAEAGARFVIVGHSERRADHGESDAIVRAKVVAARRAGLIPIVCVGETLAERDAGVTLDVLSRQIAGSLPDEVAPATHVIAYEPVWAIGTGRTPSSGQIQEVHAHVRARLLARHGAAAAGVRILYGGSVKPSNAAEFLALPDVDGALVGGASLTAADFLPIVAAAG